MNRFPVAEKVDFEFMGVKKELVEGIIELLRKEKVSYAEAYQTLDATYRLMKYQSEFLHL